jgi:hypothetical protein
MGLARVREQALLSLVQTQGYSLLMDAIYKRLQSTLRRMEREDDPRAFSQLAGEVRAYRAILGDPDELSSLAIVEMNSAHQELNRLGAGMT